MRSLVSLATTLILVLAVPAVVPAQTPAPIVVPTLPPNTPGAEVIRTVIGVAAQIIQQQRLHAANNASGSVTYFRRYEMQVRTGANAYRTVHLHPGTVIDPRGGTPGVGTIVDVSGQGQPDGSLDADTITIHQ